MWPLNCFPFPSPLNETQGVLSNIWTSVQRIWETFSLGSKHCWNNPNVPMGSRQPEAIKNIKSISHLWGIYDTGDQTSFLMLY